MTSIASSFAISSQKGNFDAADKLRIIARGIPFAKPRAWLSLSANAFV
jgi:hypothetical protein